MTDARFLRTLIPSLPSEFANALRNLCSTNSANELFLENFVRLLTGAECTSDASQSLRDEWVAKQTATRQALAELVQTPAGENSGALKRPLDQGDTEGSKRQRVSPPDTSTDLTSDPVQFTLHAVSTTSPVRKKVDISIRKSSVTFTNPSSGNVEATVPLSSLKRAFLLPTRGKTKAHWTVVILSNDVTEKAAAKAKDDSPQIIFGIDASTTAPLYTTSLNGKETHAKGSPSLPAIRAFLSNLPKEVTVHEPSTDEFKSSVNQLGSTSASSTGVPGVEAYRAAKQGNLWFMKEGLLWGESKPCEFWALEDLLNPSEGVRLSPGSGRVFSVTVVRKSSDEQKMKVEGEEEEEDLGFETEMSMIDSRERDGVFDWVRKHQNMFGRKPGDAPAPAATATKSKAPVPSGPLTIRSIAMESDSEDEDFVGSDSDSDGSGSSEDDEEGSDEDGEGEDDEEEEDAEGSNAENEEDGDEELDPARHPLMRPGAMPKMSKAVMDAVVGMVEDDFMGAGDAEGEVDELDD